MKKILFEYSNIMAYILTGFVFGISFFLLFINIYHYKDVNDVYVKQDIDYVNNQELINKLDSIDKNINNFDINSYTGNEDSYSLLKIQNKLNICLEKINNEKLHNILNKRKINISDIYDMQQFYKIDISNECLVKQLYDLTLEEEISSLKISSLSNMAPFLEDNINNLIYSTDYVQKVIRNNSSYYFNSDSSKIGVFNQTTDTYYYILNSYNSAVDFIYDVSVWYNKISGGAI